MGDRQRSEAEWKFGMGKPSSERIRERLAEESLYAARAIERVRASRNRWVVPTQENNREKWSFLLRDRRKDKQGGTTGVFVKSLSSLLQCFRKGRGFFIARLLPR